MIVDLKGGALSFFDENYPSWLLALVFKEETGAIWTLRFLWNYLAIFSRWTRRDITNILILALQHSVNAVKVLGWVGLNNCSCILTVHLYCYWFRLVIAFPSFYVFARRFFCVCAS